MNAMDFYLEIWCNCTICESSTCETVGGCLKSLMKTKFGIDEVSYKCVEWVPHDRPLLCYVDKNAAHFHAVKCCKNRDYCAADLQLTFEPENQNVDNQESGDVDGGIGWKVSLIVCASLSLILLVTLLYLCKRYRGVQRFSRNRNDGNGFREAGRYSGSSAILNDDDTRLIEPIHIAKEIEKDNLIGRGKFGSVYRCLYKSQLVAVKVFQSNEREAWQREEEIYMTPLFRHKNVLHFIASDSIATDFGIELWLVTRYYELGSLYDFLNKTSINKSQLISLAKSLAMGVEFLHDEVCGHKISKPGIAHRDLKSSNIMVMMETDGYSCCIGDFGTAARYYSSTGRLDMSDRTICGTTRYLAPEILDGSINVKNFNSLRQADVYAMALVLWELCWRSEHSGIINAYQVPYYDTVPNNPSMEDMKTSVCHNGVRPTFPESWSNSKVLSKFQEIIKECWAEKPANRLPALRIVMKINDICVEND